MLKVNDLSSAFINAKKMKLNLRARECFEHWSDSLPMKKKVEKNWIWDRKRSSLCVCSLCSIWRHPQPQWSAGCTPQALWHRCNRIISVDMGMDTCSMVRDSMIGGGERNWRLGRACVGCWWVGWRAGLSGFTSKSLVETPREWNEFDERGLSYALKSVEKNRLHKWSGRERARKVEKNCYELSQ